VDGGGVTEGLREERSRSRQAGALANVPFDAEDVAVASITPGSTGGDPAARALRDPGLGRALLDALLVDYPNLRPRRGQS